MDAAAGVRHLQQRPVSLLGERYTHTAAGGGEFGGIGQQVPEDSGGVFPVDAHRQLPGTQIGLQGHAADGQRLPGLAAQLVKKDRQVCVLPGEGGILRQHNSVGEIGNGAQQTVVALTQDTGIRIVPGG